MTTVIHIRDKKPGDIYIGRGSKWGNPFKIGIDGTRDEVIEKYRQYFLNRPELYHNIHTLQDKRIYCFCSPKACHGDILAEMAHNPTLEL